MAVTVRELQAKRERGEKIVMVTAYDACFAGLADAAGVDVILVGDSLGTVVQGKPSTVTVTLDDMLYHTRLVSRVTTKALVIADIPFLIAHLAGDALLRAAGRLMQESGAGGVKVEGGKELAEKVAGLVAAGIPTIGHVGLQPQQVNRLGGYRVQGKTANAAEQIVIDAKALEAAGACAVVIEAVPSEVAEAVTQALAIPTIGIGAGPSCSGQVLVINDLLGLALPGQFQAKFVKRFDQLGERTISAIESYAREVRAGEFPAAEHTYTTSATESCSSAKEGAAKAK